jgi:hypothetical protein
MNLTMLHRLIVDHHMSICHQRYHHHIIHWRESQVQSDDDSEGMTNLNRS